MKQIKAFVRRSRVSAVLQALEVAGFNRISLFDVKGLLQALSEREQEFSVNFGEQVISEVQIELFCTDAEVQAAVEVLQQVGATRHADSGWIYISDVERCLPIVGGQPR